MSHAIFIKFFVFCISKASDYERLTFSLYSSLLNHGQGISKKMELALQDTILRIFLISNGFQNKKTKNKELKHKNE